MTDLSAAFQELLAVFDRMEIRFLIGGSVASAAHGLARQTNDIDILADIPHDRAPAFCDALRPRFYADAAMAQRAIDSGLPFNVIHIASAYKFDIFPAADDEFAHSELGRCCYTNSTITGLENIEFPVASPEDSILSKLVWFRKGGEVSDRQWGDILGMIRIQRDRLDNAYLTAWAAKLGVTDLLLKAQKTNPR